jgi:hypothetical protein
LDAAIERSIKDGRFASMKLNTTNYTFYILDTIEPLKKEEAIYGHQKTWRSLANTPDLFSETIDEIITQQMAKDRNVTLGEVSYPYVVGRTVKKYLKKLKEGSLAV